MRIRARQALLPQGWAGDTTVTLDADGRIARVEPGATSSTDHETGILLPAPVNAHSHAFQRAMAGLTERRGPDPRDSFWTWRTLMYRFLDRLTPDDVEAVTAFAQMEMLEAGYAACAEFHYLHHRPGGTPHDRLAEMSGRICAAAATTGIGLTLLPVHYRHGGCDARPLEGGQLRFGTDPDAYLRLLDDTRAATGALPLDTRTGIALHSLRAVAPETIPAIVALASGGPVHMHIAEQEAEVAEVHAAWGARPVEWLLANAPPDETWCLIHCTQMRPRETTALAATGAAAGLCPITESSLGDGIFDGVRWMEAGGRIAIGTDSNIRIALSEEIRTLEYSQRLRDRSRAALAAPDRSTGRRLYDAILAGGAQAAGRDAGRIEPGAWADLLALDDTAIDLEGRTGDTALDTWIFAADDRLVTDVWSAGRHRVANGRHIARAPIEARYRATIRRLADAL